MSTKNNLINSFLRNIEGWKSVLDSSPDLIAILDTEFKVTWVNKAMAESLNAPPNSCLGLKCFEAVHGTQSPIPNCPHAKMILDGQEYTEEVNEENLGGCFIVTASPIRDESGNILGSIHIARDNRKHKKAEENIRGLANVVESSEDAIITKSLEGSILSWNKGAEHIYGYSAEEILGEHISLLEPVQLGHETVDLITKIKEGERIDHYETLRLRKDGALINVSVTLSPVFSTSGDLVAISAISRDITGRKEIEEQNQKLLEDVQQFAEELEVSNEELQATTEELQVANEELRQQGEDMIHLNHELRESEQRVRLKLESIISPDMDIGNLDLVDILDISAVQALIDKFYELNHVPMAIIDLKGEVLVGVGWQDICTNFHRIHPETYKHCIESDTQLSAGVPAGEFSLYRCKNNMWDIATPIIIGGKHVGNLFSGQFFFDDEELDYELFKKQAQKYSFNEEEYISALKSVPRLSREFVDGSMAFFIKLADMISQMSYNNIKLARSLTEQKRVESEKQKLLEETQQFAEELQVSNEELQSTTEELQVSNEELRHQEEELLRTNQALRESEEKFLKAFHANPAPMTLSDAEGRYIDVNESYSRLTGYSNDELIGHTSAELNIINPEKRKQYLIKLQEKGLEQDIEFEMQTKSGEKRIIISSSELIELGTEIRNISFIYDITKRKQAEEALRESEERFRDLADNIPNLAWMADADGWIFWYNKQWYDYTGTTLEEMQGWGWQKVHHPDYVEPVTEEWSRSIKEGKPYDNIFPLKGKDGNYRWFLTRVTPILDENGKIQRWFGTNTDITERKQVEEALNESEKRYRELLENSFDAVVIHQKGKVVFANSAAERILGAKKPDEFINKPILDFVHPDYRKSVAKRIQKMLVDDIVVPPMEQKFLRVNGESIYVEVIATPFYYNDEKAVQVVFRDITDRKLADNALKNANERFDQVLNKLTDYFAIADSEWRYLYVNDAYVQFIGKPREQLLGHVVWDIIPEAAGTPNYENCLKTAEDRIPRTWTSYAPFTDRWMEYRTFAWDEGVAILSRDITESKEAEEAILWNQQRNELLAEVSSRLLSSENPQGIIDDICQKTMEFLECDVFFNYLVNEEKGCLHLNAYAGIPEEEANRIKWLDYGAAVCGCVALESRRIIAENIFETPDPRTDLVKEYGVQAYACHPLVIEGMSIGTLSFGTNSRTSFTDEELELMKAVADQIAIAMNRLISNRILKESEEAAIQVRNEWEHTFEAVPDLIAILDTNYKVVRVNKAMADKFGVTSEECIGLTCYNIVHEMNGPPSFCPHHQLLKDGSEHTEEVHEDNLGGDFLVSASPLHDSKGKLIGSVHVARDINARKRREKELYQLNKAYMALNNSSQAMIRANDELEYLEDVCQIIVEDCGHSMVWVGYAEEDENKTVRPVAYSGFEEGYLETLNITWADNERGRGPTGTAIRTGKPSACKNMLTDPKFEPWRENAIERGYASSLVLPLGLQGEIFGALTIYSVEPDSFSEDEVKLLIKLAENLSYGINVIRLRIAREQMEEALIRSENEFRTLAENSPDVIARFDRQNRHIYINPAAAEPYGLSQEDIIGKTHAEIEMDPEKTEFWERHHNKVFTTGKPESMEFKYISPQGEEYYYNTRIVPEFVDGEVKSVLAISRDITYIKDAEAELKEARDNLEEQVKERTLELQEAYESLKLANEYNRSLIEASVDPLVTIGPDGKITDVNYSTELITGYSREEIIGTDFSDYFTEPEKARAGYQEVFREGWVFDYPLEIKHKEGHVTPVLYNASVYRNEDGKVIGVFAAARDVTEIKQAENEIKRQAELLNLTQEAIIVRNMENKILFWNNGAAKLYGWNVEEAKGEITHSLLQTEFPVILKEVNKQLISNGRWDGELIHTKRDGTQITVLSRQVLKRDEKGNPISILEINSDISERKKMEEELEYAGKYNRSLIETSLDPFVTIGPDGKITDVNGATEAVTGYSRDELVATDFSDYFTEPEKAREGYKQVFREGWVIDYPLEIKHRDGHVTPVLYNASVYENEFGEVIGVFAAARDITERKKAEKMLKLKLDELARSNAELEQFAYVSSHDLQEPLRMIGSYLQLLQRRYHGELDDKADRYIDFAVDGASRMQNLINDLLEFSRVTTRAREFKSTDCELILNHVLSNLEVSIKENDAIISHDHLPTVMADSTQLAQVFQNLISNAIKFRSEKTPEITISAREEGDNWVFSIADNGIGIDSKHCERIFEVFKRLHKRREYPGTGIGLSICKKIVERHGGHIWIESEPNNGSTFYFTLPVKSC